MNYKIMDMDKYYRRGVFHHFSEDCKCSVSISSRLDVTELVVYSKQKGTKFYIDFLYILAKVLNSREDYRLGYLYETGQVIVYDKINPIQYIFHEDTETCTPVYTEYFPNYQDFYECCMSDIVRAKESREYSIDMVNHPNWFDASYISWLSYDSLNVEFAGWLPLFSAYRELGQISRGERTSYDACKCAIEPRNRGWLSFGKGVFAIGKGNRSIFAKM